VDLLVGPQVKGLLLEDSNEIPADRVTVHLDENAVGEEVIAQVTDNCRWSVEEGVFCPSVEVILEAAPKVTAGTLLLRVGLDDEKDVSRGIFLGVFGIWVEFTGFFQ
jgi:hypothetical protein